MTGEMATQSRALYDFMKAFDRIRCLEFCSFSLEEDLGILGTGL